MFIIHIGITGFFSLPLMFLLYVQSKNFLAGKTTMERFGRVGAENDRETRMLNSGINDDTQIYRASVTRVNSYPGNSLRSASEDRERLMSTQEAPFG